MSISLDSLGVENQFEVNVADLHEIGGNGEEIEGTRIELAGTRFFVFEFERPSRLSNASLWRYVGKLPNNATVALTLALFHQTTNFKFAGRSILIPANTVKMTVKVASWPFLNSTNQLGITMGMKSDANKTKTITDSDGDTVNRNLQWLTFSAGGYSLYCSFLPVAIIDGRVGRISFKKRKTTNAAVAVIPHFDDEVDVDPNFSVLVDPNYGETDDGGKTTDGNGGDTSTDGGGSILGDGKSDTPLIVGVTVGVVGAVALSVVGAVVVYPRLRTRKQLREAKEGIELGKESNV